MKYSLYLLLVFSLLFCAAGDARAGFIIKKHAATESVTTVRSLTNATAATVVAGNAEHGSHLFNIIKKVTHPLMGYRNRPSEWVGIAAMLTGVIGLFVPGVNFLAILFGVLGMGRNCRTRGLAVAGFVLGVLELILFLLIGSTFVSLILL